MFQDGMKLSGKLTISVNDEVVKEVDNLVVSAGKDFVASRMEGTTDAVMSHMAIGTDSTAAAAGDTTLGSESARVALTSTSVSSNVITYAATFGAGTPSSAAAITEAGLFNNSTGGTLLCRTVFDVVNKGASDSMTISWAVTVS